MECLHLDGTVCRAHDPNANGDYSPDAETVKEYCKNSSNMVGCPRMQIYHNYLKARTGK